MALMSQRLKPPPHLNEDVEIRKITTDQEWQKVNELQCLCADPKYLNEYYIEFKTKQMSQYREMSQAGRGHWFGAYLGSTLVADLGIFFEGNLGRYQNVGTHPEYRRQGICGTLVYKSGLMAFDGFKVKTLVMEADTEYHAARIYESVGFHRHETNYSLSWWKGKGNT